VTLKVDRHWTGGVFLDWLRKLKLSLRLVRDWEDGKAGDAEFDADVNNCAGEE